MVQKEHRGISDPDQSYILNELIRYLSDERSGVLRFEGMGPGWTKVKDGAREQTLRRTDPEVAAVAARWDDLIRYLGLMLTKILGRDVKQLLPKKEQTPAARAATLKEGLATSGRLSAQLQIPDAAGVLEVVADLRARQVSVRTRVEAPKDARSKGRVSWVLRQLQDAPEALTIEAHSGRGQSLVAPLSVLRQQPDVLYPEGTKEIRTFTLTLNRNMGLKKASGKGSFVDSVTDSAEEFYGQVLQNLRAWKAAPPKIKKPSESGAPGATDLLPPLVEEATTRVSVEAADHPDVEN